MNNSTLIADFDKNLFLYSPEKKSNYFLCYRTSDFLKKMKEKISCEAENCSHQKVSGEMKERTEAFFRSLQKKNEEISLKKAVIEEIYASIILLLPVISKKCFRKGI